MVDRRRVSCGHDTACLQGAEGGGYAVWVEWLKGASKERQIVSMCAGVRDTTAGDHGRASVRAVVRAVVQLSMEAVASVLEAHVEWRQVIEAGDGRMGGAIAGERTLQEDHQHPERLLSVLVENKE